MTTATLLGGPPPSRRRAKIAGGFAAFERYGSRGPWQFVGAANTEADAWELFGDCIETTLPLSTATWHIPTDPGDREACVLPRGERP